MTKNREVVFRVDTVMCDAPMEVRFQSRKHGGSLWAEAHDRVADMLRDGQNGDQVYRIEMIQSHEPILHD